jgi:hypothetical protein
LLERGASPSIGKESSGQSSIPTLATVSLGAPFPRYRNYFLSHGTPPLWCPDTFVLVMINNGYMGLIRQAEKNYDMKPVTERLPEPLATFPEPVG